MNETARDTVKNFYGSAARKEDQWQDYLGEDVSFSVAAEKKFEGKDVFIKTYTTFLQAVEKIDIQKLFVEGNTVCAIVAYDYVSPNGTSFHQTDAEVWELAGGKIVSFTVYYDATEFRELMAH